MSELRLDSILHIYVRGYANAQHSCIGSVMLDHIGGQKSKRCQCADTVYVIFETIASVTEIY